MTKATKISLLLFLVAENLFAFVIYSSFSSEVKYRLNVKQTELSTAVDSIASSYGRLVEAVFQSNINSQKIINLVSDSNYANKSELGRIRGRIYRQLYPTFKLLQERNIRVLQFVHRDGTSLLRMNRPDLLGDDIANDRAVLQRALKQKQFTTGFENGRIYPGYRYAFPLIKNQSLVGLADFSVAFDAFYDVLISKTENEKGFSQFLLKRELVEEVAHPSVTSLFRPTNIHEDFIIEDEESSLRDITRKLVEPTYLDQLNISLGKDPAVAHAMTIGKTFSFWKCLDDHGCFQVVLLAVNDSLKRPAAYIIGYYPSDAYNNALQNHLVIFLLGTFSLLLIGRSYRQWFRSRQRLQTISENMAEGMYVMNNHGKIVFSNTAAQSILGFSRNEMKGQSGHDLFHHHSGDVPVPRENCPIRTYPMEGKVYRSSNETFRQRSGGLIRVEVTSSPLREEGEISGAVVLFKDISQEYENLVRKHQTEAAFENMAEAVLVTNANANIVAVNQAFTKITGYTEAEVLGKNPKLLSSGQHNKAFYKKMWDALIDIGYWEGKLTNRNKSGDTYPEWASITAIKDKDDNIISYVSVFSDLSEKIKKEQRLQELANIDQLTGLPNRTSFINLLSQSILNACRNNKQMAILFIDLDHFKHINDSLGHTIGDQLLKDIGLRIRDCVRQVDVVARLGGDEFVIMMEDYLNDEAPARIANKLHQCMKEPLSINDSEFHITASIGISIYPVDGTDPTTLLKNADSAMYRSKQKGRGSFCYFTEDIAKEVEEYFVLENNLRKALKNQDELVVYYQPKISLADQSIIGAEALIRWQHPKRGIVSPIAFLPIAHDAGLIKDITVLVIQQVSRQIHAWNKIGLNPGLISINLDDQTLNQDDAVKYLKELVISEGLEPNELELEITETVLADSEKASKLYAELVETGFTLSIDDFGTGESSLFRLKELPVHTLKIDRAFVKNIEHSHVDIAILHSITKMAKALGMHVLCEGVETSKQLRLIKSIGCDAVQGYLIAKPMPAEMVPKFHSDYSIQNESGSST